jgi:hypothetical protein
MKKIALTALTLGASLSVAQAGSMPMTSGGGATSPAPLNLAPQHNYLTPPPPPPRNVVQFPATPGPAPAASSNAGGLVAPIGPRGETIYGTGYVQTPRTSVSGSAMHGPGGTGAELSVTRQVRPDLQVTGSGSSMNGQNSVSTSVTKTFP